MPGQGGVCRPWPGTPKRTRPDRAFLTHPTPQCHPYTAPQSKQINLINPPETKKKQELQEIKPADVSPKTSARLCPPPSHDLPGPTRTFLFAPASSSRSLALPHQDQREGPQAWGFQLEALRLHRAQHHLRLHPPRRQRRGNETDGCGASDRPDRDGSKRDGSCRKEAHSNPSLRTF